MTSKELLYVEDALSHEEFLKSCACQTSEKLQDPTLSKYMEELKNQHEETFKNLLNLL